MNRDQVQLDLLCWLSRLPLLDRLELAALSGWSRSAVYRAVDALERHGLVEPHRHASELIAPTRRYTLTAAGLRRLAAAGGPGFARLLREQPVSEQARRLFLGRIDALAVSYRLLSAISDVAYPLQARCYRALPLDICARTPDGRTLALVRLGRSNDRTSAAKRLGRLRDGPPFSAVLVLAPDEIRLRHAARRLRSVSTPCYLALERDAARAGADARIWRTPALSAAISLREALSHALPRGAWPAEEPLTRVSPPAANPPAHKPTDWTLAARLGPAEKRVLDLLADWPWFRLDHFADLLGVSQVRLRELLRRAEQWDLTRRLTVSGRARLALSERGLALIARRDRASVGDQRKRWSPELLDPAAGIRWRNLRGTRTRQLMRHLEHTESVHDFLAELADQTRDLERELVQLDPPQRASRYFQFEGRQRSIHPDAFAVLREGDRDRPLFLEWERRAVRPATMRARLAPYLRYYSTHRPADDHGVVPVVLVVFEDELAATHFLRLAAEEMQRARVELPLRVSDRGTLERSSPLGPVWSAPERLAPAPPW